MLYFGCGSGRDTKYFLGKGYDVDATDGSKELCKIAGEYAGVQVKQMLFEGLDAVEEYDGVWVCASILHVEKKQLPDILGKIAAATKKGDAPVGTEELAHMEIVSAIIHQLTKDLTPEEIVASGFDKYYVDAHAFVEEGVAWMRRKSGARVPQAKLLVLLPVHKRLLLIK